ncbi:MAG: hypothetical protein ACN23H_02535 [Candidatus Phytoplasma vitis]|nr:MAG: hypothetical protein M6G77_01195 [Candidatus Phytoplasma vitis]
MFINKTKPNFNSIIIFFLLTIFIFIFYIFILYFSFDIRKLTNQTIDKNIIVYTSQQLITHPDEYDPNEDIGTTNKNDPNLLAATLLTALRKKHNKLYSKNRYAEKLLGFLKERDKELLTTKNDLTQKEEALTTTQNTLTQKEEELRTIKSTLTQKEKELKTIKSTLNRKE